jgi:hypothetical protein
MKIENCATSDSLVPTSHVSYNYCDGKWKIKSYTLNPRCERRRKLEAVVVNAAVMMILFRRVQKGRTW